MSKQSKKITINEQIAIQLNFYPGKMTLTHFEHENQKQRKKNDIPFITKQYIDSNEFFYTHT